MVFLIQNTQNRDAKAILLKLDELLRGVKGARTGLVRLEELTEDELKELEASFEALRLRTGGTNGTASVPPKVRTHGLSGIDSGSIATHFAT